MEIAIRQRDAESLFAENGSLRPGWKTAIASMVCLIVSPSVLAPLSFGVFSPYLRDAFGWSVGEIGRGVAAMSISVMITSLISGFIIDRFGVRRVVLICIPVFSIGFAMMGLQDGSQWQFLLAWLLVPLLGLGLWPGAWGKATAGWFDTRLGLAMAIATLGVGIGAATMPFVIHNLADALGWRMAYFSTSLIAVLVAFPMAYIWLREAPAESPHEASPNAAVSDRIFFAAFRDIRLICLCLAFLALGWFSAVLLANLVMILESNGMTREQAVIAQSVVGISTICGRVLCGWLLDRVAFRIVVPAFCLACAAAVAVLAGGASGGAALVIAVFVGMMIGAEIDVLGFAIQRQFGRVRFATLFGLIFALFHFGGALGGIISGNLHDMTGSFTQALLSASGGLVFAAIILGLMPWAPRKPA